MSPKLNYLADLGRPEYRCGLCDMPDSAIEREGAFCHPCQVECDYEFELLEMEKENDRLTPDA